MNLFLYLGYDHPVVRTWIKFRALRSKCHLKCGPYAWDLTKDARVIRISRGQFSAVARLAKDFDDLFEALLPVHTGHCELLDFSRLHVHTYRAANLKFEFAQWPEPDAPIDAYFEVFRPGEKDLVFDLGAEYGVSTYLLAQVAAQVVAYEPELPTRAILERNVERHALANVKVAKDATGSLAEMVRLYGDPALCRINLDRLPLKFLLTDAGLWTSQAVYIAARSNSKAVRKKFAQFLQDSGYMVGVDNDLGMIWGGPG